ncbi:MAG: putative LPS assembly protein LptD [Gemmatimonadaceae bacterium]
MIAWVRRTLCKATVCIGVAMVASASTLVAQVTPPVKPDSVVQPPGSVRSLPPDTIKKTPASVRSLPPDTIRKNGKLDTIPKLARDKQLVDWEPPDTVVQELDKRAGYRKVKYQGDSIRFDAKTGDLRIGGIPAAVQRDETILVGKTIVYNDSTKIVRARGDSVTLRDPTQTNADDFVVVGGIDYDLNVRSGRVGAFNTSVEAGSDRLFLEAKSGEVFSDTLVSGRHTVIAADGSFTYCDQLEPHFHFTTKSMKFVSQNIMVARPGVLYIGEVPVFWIPFFFQDVRKGRRSGLLTPNFGIAELIRNSPSYRRQVNNMGYYFSINDYMGAELSFDWRSGANSSLGDQGFVRGNLEYSYRWINRFISGRFAADELAQNDGRKNLSITWNHSQDFSKQTRLTSNLNWVQSTQIQRNTTLNPIAATASILSQLNYQTKIGPASIQLGGTRRQYPGRTQVETQFPTISVTASPVNLGGFSWTPSGRISIDAASGLDQGLQFPYIYSPRPGGGTDSTRINASRRNLTAGFEAPIKIYGFNWQNSFSLTEQYNNFPEQRKIINVNNPADSTTRIFSKTYQTNFDWTTSFSLPSFLRGSWNVSPQISVNNVDPQGGLLVRTELSGGKWISQSKRLSYGISSAPALYAQFPGFGPIARFRHGITPTFNYSFSPAANVSDEFLGALGRTRTGYLGSLAQNRVSMGLATTLEAKLKAKSDSAGAEQRKIELLSLNFSSLSWDFIRADTAGTGLVESNFSIGGRSALLPGFDFRANYSLFQGDPLSDTATFKFYRTDFGTTFSLNSHSAIFAVLGRLLGIKGGNLDDAVSTGARRPNVADDVIASQREQSSAAGSRRRSSVPAIPQGNGWSLNLQYNAARQRPPVGGTIIQNDQVALCDGLKPQGQAIYDQCVLAAQTNPQPGSTSNYRIGAPTYISPPTQNVTSALTFNVTPSWSAQWSTSYDVERARFASQQVGLQRQLHDWTTTFSFTQSPNGAFSFAFYIALKAQPSLKFDYNRATYRSSGGY